MAKFGRHCLTRMLGQWRFIKSPEITLFYRSWLVQPRLDLAFLQPIALLWTSVQPFAQAHLSCAIFRQNRVISGLILQLLR
jgi:hypothetical protein